MTTSQIETQTVLVATAVYSVMQSSKNNIPAVCAHLHGWVAVAVNVLLCAVPIFVTTDAGARFTLPTLVSILIAASAAAGIHGTLSKTGVSNGAS